MKTNGLKDKIRDVLKSWHQLVWVLVALFSTLPVQADKRRFVHPGISYTQADFDRMKAMIAAKVEPFYSSYLAFKDSRYVVYRDYTMPLPVNSKGDAIIWENANYWLGDFGNIALANAIMWKLTDENKYADKAVAVLNRYIPVKSVRADGSSCLDNSNAKTLIEAAELIRDYSGWKAEDQQGFKDFLVYPGYSTTEDMYEKYASRDSQENNITIYWNIFQGAQRAHGNQGLYGMNCLLAMGIYLDNDTIYDRAYRKILSMKHRSDDLAYPKGPQTGVWKESSNPDYYDAWGLNPYMGQVTLGDIEDYGYDDELQYWIYENGQCQEASRDQGHIMDGMCNVVSICDIAWNQGDDILTKYDNRLLKGITYAAKYNYGWRNNHWANQAFWQGEDDWEPTVENGEFISCMSRNGGWRSKKINPWTDNAADNRWSRGKLYYTTIPMVNDYKIRLGLPDDDIQWVLRAHEVNEDSIRRYQIADEYYLKQYRTAWMAGDAGTFQDGLHVSGIHAMPGSLKAVDYDFYNNELDGDTHTYHASAARTDQLYRKEGGMSVKEEDNGFVVTKLQDGDWMSYTVSLPKTATYAVSVKAKVGNTATLGFAVDGSKEQTVMVGASADYETLTIGNAVIKAGARVLRIYVHDINGDLSVSDVELKEIASSDETVEYVWNSRDYEPTEGSGSFRTDVSSTNLYATEYASSTQPNFLVAAPEMNYQVAKDQLYLVVRGDNLNRAFLKSVKYQLSPTASVVEKKSSSGQLNQLTKTLEDGSTLLVWKLDSTTNKRVSPLLKECYASSANDAYNLRSLSLLIEGSSVRTSTQINEITFCTQEELLDRYQVSTGVSMPLVQPKMSSSKLYDLNGRMVGDSYQGVVIKSNKKYIHK